MVGGLLQPFQVVELDMAAFAADESLILKPGKYPAYGFLRYSQMITYIAPRHAQIKLRR